MPDNGLQHTIVVGVDGSENGRRALEWALEEAKLRQMSCLLVHGVEFGMAASSPYIGSAYGDLEAAGQAVLDQEVAFATSSGITISSRLDLGSPAHALIEASKCGHARRRHPWPRRLRRTVARFGLRGVRPPRPLSRDDHPARR